ncbi:nonribosomal peptide synthetase MxaA [Starkeya koreensis]|uniref:Nonribosomal peptide synthetase MxaA n=1 Tax=Ancylobacter koreensis TaxID=266121 RepID=A0ABT0DMY7_9HYPH|nr:nonribosomal peptide synthetase MxaA [Ancylobacter koreensis]MCK0208502.1 nonribosomal peptide synthetase MxaA [Ancylobacter koreensis]
MSLRAFAGLLAVALLLVPLPAGAQVRSVELYAPRAFGYVIGDTLSLSADIVLDAPFTLDAATLPTPRALDYWLDLRDVRLVDRGEREGVRHYTLDLVYQTFYAPLEPRRMALPGLSLSAVADGRRVAVEVPGWSFLMSPLREIVATGPGPAMALRPDIPPMPIPTGETFRRLIAALGLALAALLALAWQMGWGPFGRRAGRPFARAARAMPPGLEGSPAAYGGALRVLHRAFDATAGKGVFAEDLPDFFTAHPAFRAVEAEVARLFEASRRAFFGDDFDGARRELPPAELVALSRRLRAVERGSA